VGRTKVTLSRNQRNAKMAGRGGEGAGEREPHAVTVVFNSCKNESHHMGKHYKQVPLPQTNPCMAKECLVFSLGIQFELRRGLFSAFAPLQGMRALLAIVHHLAIPVARNDAPRRATDLPAPSLESN
jgi:hypothetical protein